ncbi:hypothetical protein [Streptococcus pluranimalium]|uniref:hypothetical protein n=1 Tax=Streptococcus pluranimalium TaxID=82348 RepID=UPI002415706D|nr:hypothetical protein [Streptococcus pluranimalium]MDY3042150.1 hypothetical protein [Streptococcus pluranimalium]WFM79375.1 hypothetical protein P7F70_07510 [Streptococcus pluranimalium]HEM6117046.1 hypothetical protein [Streptococcus suis]
MSTIQMIALILLLFSILKAIALIKVFSIFKPDPNAEAEELSSKTEDELRQEEDEAEDDSLF